MELADVLDSKSNGLITRAGSTLAAGTKPTKSEPDLSYGEMGSDFVFSFGGCTSPMAHSTGLNQNREDRERRNEDTAIYNLTA